MADPQLKIRITADLAAIRASLGALQGDLTRVNQRLQQTGSVGTTNMNRLQGGLSNVASAARGLFASLAVGLAVRAFITTADQANNLAARLRLVTSSQEELNRAQAGAFEIAQRTRTSLQATIDLYSRLQRSTEKLGLVQGEVLQLTETINKAGQIGGGGPGLEAALFQLGQGLQSGTLRGEELNSVLEQAPRLAKAIQDGLQELGVNGAENLRKLAEQGQLTPELIVQAVLTQQQKLDAEFAKLPQTVAGSLTQLKNSLTLVTGEIDRAAGSSGGLAEAISRIADAIAQADFSPVVQFLNSAGSALSDLGEDLSQFGESLAQDFNENGIAGKAFAFLKFSLTNIVPIALGAIKRVGIEFGAFFAQLTVWSVSVKDRIKAVFTDDTIDDVNDRWQAASQAIQDAKEADIAALQAEVDGQIAAGDAAVERYRREREARQRAAEEARAAQQRVRNAPPPARRQTASGAVDDAELLKDSITRALAEYERLYEAGKVRLADYFAVKRDLQQQAIDAEIQQTQRELGRAENVEQQSKALTKLALLERQRADAGIQAAREQESAERDLMRTREDLQAQLAVAQGDETAQRRLEIQRERDALLARFAGDPGASALVNRLFDVELARTRAQAIETQASELLNRLRQGEDNIAVQVEAGTLGQVTGEEQLQALRARTIEQLQQLREALAAAYAEQPSEQTAAALQGLDVEILRVKNSANEFQNSVRDLGQSSLAGFFTDIATGAQSAGQAFRGLVLQFVQGLARMAAEALAKRAILALTGGGGGLLAGVFHSGGTAGQGGTKRSVPAGAFAYARRSFAARVYHTGGMAGHGAIQRLFPAAAAAAMFAVAPRFHTGGVAGLAPGEVPAILKQGERVLNPQETARYNAGQASAPASPGMRVVNVFDPSFVPDQLNSADGERVIMNIIGRNPGRVRQLLG